MLYHLLALQTHSIGRFNGAIYLDFVAVHYPCEVRRSPLLNRSRNTCFSNFGCLNSWLLLLEHITNMLLLIVDLFLSLIKQLLHAFQLLLSLIEFELLQDLIILQLKVVLGETCKHLFMGAYKHLFR